jgi:hypothetical protein
MVKGKVRKFGIPFSLKTTFENSLIVEKIKKGFLIYY